MDRIAILLGGIAAEELLFGDFGNGAAGHEVAGLDLATKLATMIEIEWGFAGSLAVELADSPKRLEKLRMKRKALQSTSTGLRFET